MKKYKIILPVILLATILFVSYSCTNPFAPAKGTVDPGSELLGDQRYVEGLFKNFRYAYIFKDTLVYGKLLTDDFKFIYRNYDNDNTLDLSWGRDDEMLTTSRLFQTAQSFDLVWNNIVSVFGDSLTLNVKRGFSLKIEFSPTDPEYLYGLVNLTLRRTAEGEPWKIQIWRDESNGS